MRNVFGKKKAKEECARLTLAYLQDVREQRVNAGRRMLQGVRGGESVLSATGRAVEGEGSVLVTEGGEKEMGGESEEEFEDAVEDIESNL